MASKSPAFVGASNRWGAVVLTFLLSALIGVGAYASYGNLFVGALAYIAAIITIGVSVLILRP